MSTKIIEFNALDSRQYYHIKDAVRIHSTYVLQSDENEALKLGTPIYQKVNIPRYSQINEVMEARHGSTSSALLGKR